MDIHRYLKEKQHRLQKSSEKIRDFRVFDFNYIPAKPLMRCEAKELIDAILRYQQTGIANHTLILGSRGSGKSLLARYLMTLLAEPDKLTFVYANCRQHNTSFKILAAIMGLRPRGCSLDELWLRFVDQQKGKVIFILDEIDLMSEKDKQKEILYLISRCPQNYMAVLLSNNPRFLNQLDQSTQSTLQPEIIHFKSYHPLEIEQILMARAQVGLKMLPQSIIRQIAALTVKNTNADVRVAIKTLYNWALEPQVILKDHFEKARRDILAEVIKDLNDKNLFILRAAAHHTGRYVKEIFASYQKLSSQYHEEPYGYSYFYANLSYLQSLGLILLVSTKVGRTYTNRLQLTFDPTLLETIFQLRFS
jgi:Cdc6-like AAA superfamily ATPase